MDPQAPIIAPTPPQKPKKSLRTIGIIAVVVVALAIIVASIFTLFNPNGVETDNTEKTSTVTLTDTALTPETVKIKSGESVMWTNAGTFGRSLVLTSSDPQQDVEGFGNDEPMLEGESYSFTFDVTGTFTYEDPAQPDIIKGKIIVE